MDTGEITFNILDDQIEIPPFYEMELPKLLSLIPSLKAKAFS